MNDALFLSGFTSNEKDTKEKRVFFFFFFI